MDVQRRGDVHGRRIRPGCTIVVRDRQRDSVEAVVRIGMSGRDETEALIARTVTEVPRVGDDVAVRVV